MHLNTSAIRSPDRVTDKGGGVQHFLDRRIALDAGLLFSHGKFTAATVNGAPVPDYRGDAVWSSRFNLGGRMYFR
jgi:hypothetical protein